MGDTISPTSHVESYPHNSTVAPFTPSQNLNVMNSTSSGFRKRSRPESHTGESSSRQSRHPTKQQKSDAAAHIGLHKARFFEVSKTSILTIWFNACVMQHVDPLDCEDQLKALSLLLDMPEVRIAEWCCAKRLESPVLARAEICHQSFVMPNPAPIKGNS